MTSKPKQRTKNILMFHVCTIPGFYEIVNRIVSKISSLGGCSPGFFDKVYFMTVGPLWDKDENHVESIHNLLTEPGRFSPSIVTHLGHNHNPNVYERFTLHKLHEMACANDSEDFKVFYCHSKGLSKPRNRTVQRWVEMMLQQCIGYMPLIVHLLDKYPTAAVGCLFKDVPKPHFSGNFWWTTSQRLRQLGVPIPPPYLEPEMWIGYIGEPMICLTNIKIWVQARTPLCHFEFPYTRLFSDLGNRYTDNFIPIEWFNEEEYKISIFFGFGLSWIRVPASLFIDEIQQNPSSQKIILFSSFVFKMGSEYRDPYPNQEKMLMFVFYPKTSTQEISNNNETNSFVNTLRTIESKMVFLTEHQPFIIK
jgi:hypothetical protein